MQKYEDMWKMPHHVSPRRRAMPDSERAAQFLPYAALTGYEDAVREEERLTEEWARPGETDCEVVNRRLGLLLERIRERPEAAFVYFVPDEKKSGGAYVTVAGRVRRFRESEGEMELEDGTRIPLKRLCAVEGELFAKSPKGTDRARFDGLTTQT